MNSIQIQNTNGIAITCDIAHDICNVDVSGWYYGKTAGLFGTYNYEKKDDLTTAEGEMARHVDDFTRSWKVGRRCSGSSSDTLQECNTDPDEEVNALCTGHFLDEMSSLTKCLGVVRSPLSLMYTPPVYPLAHPCEPPCISCVLPW